MAELYDLENPAIRSRRMTQGHAPMGRAVAILPIRTLALLFALVGMAAWTVGDVRKLLNPQPESRDLISAEFHVCADGDMSDCTIDSGTFFYKGQPYVIGDIVVPHGNGAACPAEAALAEQGAKRLTKLLNGGAFEMRPDVRPTDEAGRKLRILYRDDVSLGQVLTVQRVAKPVGSPVDWCTQSPSTLTSPTG